MAMNASNVSAQKPCFRIEAEKIETLISSIKARGFTIFGPTSKDGAILPQEIISVNDIPVGISDEQGPGSYRLRNRQDKSLFSYAVGPQSFKKFLFPPFLKLFSATKNGSIEVTPSGQMSASNIQYAFFGIRPCELAAVLIQDKVFLGGSYKDDYYKAVRENVLIVAVNCSQPGGTCFCGSLHSGPRALEGYDLCLTEVLKDDGHYFLVEVGSSRGEEVLADIEPHRANESELRELDLVLEAAAKSLKKRVETNGLRDILYAGTEHQRWDEIAKRCLTCTNCTMVCPTCFCSTVEDVTDLSGTNAVRNRTWDSCFTVGFSYIHGGSLRSSVKSRYRQWLTHKFAGWVDQFGTPGCVGCGRCITWCPVGIDITEELDVFAKQHSDKKL